MREPSLFPNKKHTPDTMREELEHARRAGSAREIADLALLIQNAERPKGSPCLPGTTRARNRQAQRRYNRERTFGQSHRNPGRKVPCVGDYVRVPNGEVWLVTSIEADCIHSDLVQGAGYRHCLTKLATVVEGAAQAPAQAPAKPDTLPACEALYQGVWDAYEVQDWSAVERALRAYETALAALGV